MMRELLFSIGDPRPPKRNRNKKKHDAEKYRSSYDAETLWSVKQTSKHKRDSDTNEEEINYAVKL